MVDLIFGPLSNKALFLLAPYISKSPREAAARDLCSNYFADCASYKAGQVVVLDKNTDLRFYVSDHKDGPIVAVLAGYAAARQEEQQAPGAVIPTQ